MTRTMLTLLLCLGVALAATPARAAPTPYAVDSKIKDQLAVFHDRQGHYLVLPKRPPVPPGKRLSASNKIFFKRLAKYVFYGDGKKLYRQITPSKSVNNANYSFSVLDPRVPYLGHSSFVFRKGKASFKCIRRRTPLTPLAAPAARKLLAKAKFFDLFWRRAAFALARNSRGRYFYVDRVSYPHGPLRGFRVFSGMRGKMKRLRMKNVVNDPVGQIFITRRGKLRLVLSKGRKQATWIRGRRRTPLTLVNVRPAAARRLIYHDLGVYFGKRFERPCDDW